MDIPIGAELTAICPLLVDIKPTFMCLGFDYASFVKAEVDAAATESLEKGRKAMENAGHDVDCNNVQKFVLDLKDGSTLTMALLPASSDTCVLYMYPIDPVCLGEGDEYLIPSDNIPCQAVKLDGIHNPGKYCPKPMLVEVPMFRSLGCDDEDDDTDPDNPKVTLPEGTCVKNTDGSVTFTLKLSTVVKSDEEIDASIASGEFSDRAVYNLAMGKACFNELMRNMGKNGVETGHLFAMLPEEDGPPQVHPEAMINFLDMLLPNLIAGKDIIVGVPAFDEDGKAKGAAFSLWFHYPEDAESLPLLGLVHNVDPSDPSPESKVEENFYIVTNSNRGIFAVDVSEQDLRMRTCGAFLSDKEMHYDCDYRSIRQDEYDHSAWIKACSAFQKDCQFAIWDALEEIVNKNGLPGFDKGLMLTTNLKDMKFTKHTMTMGREPAGDDEPNHKRTKTLTAPNNNTNDPIFMGDSGIIFDQNGIGKVHSILARISSEEWDDYIVTLVRRMDPNYFNDKAIGLSRFRLDLMTQPHAKALLTFLEGVTGTA